MKKRIPAQVRMQRIPHPMSEYFDDQNGAFRIDGPCGRKLNIICSNGGGWDHVSVSLADDARTPPTWEEMCFVKDLFFRPEECVIQYHPPHSRYVNIDAGCLHLWRPQDERIAMPPMEFV